MERAKQMAEDETKLPPPPESATYKIASAQRDIGYAAAPALGAAGTIATVAYERSMMVMKRQLGTYDYEKVFWNSTWTVGLVGLGYLAVKLGLMIEGIIDLPETIAKAFGLSDKNIPVNDPRTPYLIYAYYVEGPGKKKDIPVQWSLPITGPLIGWGPEVYNNVMLFRTDKIAYKAWKEQFQVAHPEYEHFYLEIESQLQPFSNLTPSGIIHGMDNFFNEYGPIIPIAVVMGHMGLEALRVHRFRRKLKE